MKIYLGSANGLTSSRVPFLPLIFGLWKASRLLAGKTVYFHQGTFVFGDVTKITFHATRLVYQGLGWRLPLGYNFEGGVLSNVPALKSVGEDLQKTGKMPKIVRITFPASAREVRVFMRLVIRTKLSLMEAAGILIEPVGVQEISNDQIEEVNTGTFVD